MKQIVNFSVIVFILSFFFSCSDFIKKDIEIEMADNTSKLVVFAGLEDDLFYVYLNLSNPISTKKTSLKSSVKDAKVKLFEEDKLLFEITEPDDFFYDPVGAGYDIKYDAPYRFNLYPYAVRKDVKITSGKNYRIEVSLNGYSTVTSTVTAPETIDIEDITLTTSSVIRPNRNRIAYAENLQPNYMQSDEFFQLDINLNDNPSQKDYYLIEAFEVQSSNKTIADFYANTSNVQRLAIATTDRMLIRENPIITASESLSDPEKNTFVFGQLVLSDLSFQGKKQNMKLLMSPGLVKQDNSCERLEKMGYNPEYIKHIDYRLVVVVKHICPDSYEFYKTFISQSEELGFFTEPVSTFSNINGGYGCFTVSSTKQFTLQEYGICYLEW